MSWVSQVRKGLLEVAVMNALNGRRLYGYDIVRRLRPLDGLVIREANVYPILSRMKTEGLVRTTLEQSPEGPARKYYELTAAGRRRLDEMNETWERLATSLRRLREGDL